MKGYLRYWLLTLLAVAWQSSALSAAEPAPAAVLTVTKMCCAKESVPAMKELYKVPGVARVIADHKARTLTIVSQPNAEPSPRALWEVVEKLNINPVRLATSEGVYQKKPAR